MKKTQSAEDLRLLSSIEALLAEGTDQIEIPLTAVNQGIAKLSVQNAKTLTTIQGRLIKSIDRFAVTNDNAVDQLGMAILAPLQDWQLENELLLTQLAAAAGLTKPGDPLEAALLGQVADEPEIAYSATLLIALRDALPYLGKLVKVLEEIRDRMPALRTHFQGEPGAVEQGEVIESDGAIDAIEVEDAPISWPEV